MSTTTTQTRGRHPRRCARRRTRVPCGVAYAALHAAEEAAPRAPMPEDDALAKMLASLDVAKDAARGKGDARHVDAYADFQAIVRALGGCKRSGAVSAQVNCPAHDDHDRALSVFFTVNGLLMDCNAGCALDAVDAAVDAVLDAAWGETPPVRQ